MNLRRTFHHENTWSTLDYRAYWNTLLWGYASQRKPDKGVATAGRNEMAEVWRKGFHHARIGQSSDTDWISHDNHVGKCWPTRFTYHRLLRSYAEDGSVVEMCHFIDVWYAHWRRHHTNDSILREKSTTRHSTCKETIDVCIDAPSMEEILCHIRLLRSYQLRHGKRRRVLDNLAITYHDHVVALWPVLRLPRKELN